MCRLTLVSGVDVPVLRNGALRTVSEAVTPMDTVVREKYCYVLYLYRGKIFVVLKAFGKYAKDFCCVRKYAIAGIYIRDSDKGMAYAMYYVIFLRKMHKQRYMQNAYAIFNELF